MLGRLLQVVALLLLSVPNVCAQYDAYHFSWPYSDLSRAAMGTSPAEACAKRTEQEYLFFNPGPNHPVIYSGLLPSGQCGFQWLNMVGGPPGYLINSPAVTPSFNTCTQFNGFVPQYPRPALCPLDCPADQKDPATGLCRLSTPKNAGAPCPACANPIHPGTGNKFQAETDLAPAGGGQLSLVRYYNSGRPTFDNVLGGFWHHSYHSKILVAAPPTLATYYRNDGKAQCQHLRALVRLHQPAVNQTAQGQRKRQGRHRCQHQKQQRQSDATPVRTQERQQAGEGLGIL